MEKFVITIARSCGSGGAFVGKTLAKKLSVEYYDSKLLRLASDDSGISEELFAVRMKNCAGRRCSRRRERCTAAN